MSKKVQIILLHLLGALTKDTPLEVIIQECFFRCFWLVDLQRKEYIHIKTTIVELKLSYDSDPNLMRYFKIK